MSTNNDPISKRPIIPLIVNLAIPPVVREELIEAANQDKGTEYFQKFLLGDIIFSFNQPMIAYNLALKILNDCRNADFDAFSLIHKGGIYYWIGIAAFFVRDYQTAVFFIDAAVSEDLRRSYDLKNPSPAIKFLLVDGDAFGHAGKPLVELMQAKIKVFLDLYNHIPGRNPSDRNFELEDLRKYFINNSLTNQNSHWRSLVTTFISFIIEWNDRNEYLDLRVNQGTSEPFYFHLFKGCVLFESLLKANPTNTPPLFVKNRNGKDKPATLINVLQFLHNDLDIPNDLPIGENDFSSIIHDLQISSQDITTSISFTGKVRNSVAHNLGWQLQFTKLDYQKLFTMIAISNIHAIAKLYIH